MIMACFYIFAFVFVLSFVVIVHEGGHFFVARCCGVRVEEFSLGFGKELFGWNDKKGTRWKICLLPLGGYVKMLGDMDAASAKSSTEHVPDELKPYTFLAQKLWKRALIIFAGPATNYVFAVLILGTVLFCSGKGVLPAIISEVEEGSVAEEIGLLAGDKILSVNGKAVEDFSDIQRAIRLTDFGKDIILTFEREGQVLSATGRPKYMDGYDYPRLGVRTSHTYMEEQDVGFFEAYGLAVKQAYTMTADTLNYIGQVLFHHRSPKEMRGPLGIAEASGDAFLDGIVVLLVFIANISVAVGLMNLLPIPLLDGGHLALYAIEAVRRKPLTEKVQNAVMWVGFSILMGLVGYTFFLDIPRIMQRILG